MDGLCQAELNQCCNRTADFLHAAVCSKGAFSAVLHLTVVTATISSAMNPNVNIQSLKINVGST